MAIPAPSPFGDRLCPRGASPAKCLAALTLDEIAHLDGDMDALCTLLAPGSRRGPSCRPSASLPLRPRARPVRQDHGDVHAGTQAGADRGLHRLPAPHQRSLSGWCAGKGHLGRLVSLHRGAEILSLEWQGALRGGRRLAARDGANMRFVEADAFAAESGALIAPHHHAMALHACGDLHTHLLTRVAEGRAQG